MNKSKRKFEEIYSAKYMNVIRSPFGKPKITFTPTPKYIVYTFAEVAEKEGMRGFNGSYTMEYNFTKDCIIGYLTDNVVWASYTMQLLEKISTTEIRDIYEELVKDKEFFLVHNPFQYNEEQNIQKVKGEIEQITLRHKELLAMCKNHEHPL
jgi:hypothetical protein